MRLEVCQFVVLTNRKPSRLLDPSEADGLTRRSDRQHVNIPILIVAAGILTFGGIMTVETIKNDCWSKPKKRKK